MKIIRPASAGRFTWLLQLQRAFPQHKIISVSYTHLDVYKRQVAFCFSAQYIVPEMARGFADKPEKLPKAIMVGMGLTRKISLEEFL